MTTLRLLVVIIITALLVQPTAAQSADRVTIDAQVGFDQAYLASTWTPITLTIGGDTRNRQVNVEWVVTRDNAVNIDWQQELNLPAQSRKSVTFTIVMPEYARNILARVRADDGKIIASTIIDAIPVTAPLHVVVSDDANTLQSLANTNDSMSNQRTFRVIPNRELPSTALALQGITTLFVAQPQQLTTAQADAIRLWVALGGFLVLAGDAAGPLQDIAVFRITGMSTTPAQLPQDAPIAWPADISVPQVTPLTPQATPVFPDNAVLWSAAYGRGSVYQYSLDFASIQGWDGQTWFWNTILDPRYPSLVSPIGQSNTYLSQEPLAASLVIFSLQRPDPFTLLVLIVLYVALIGPITYHVLKRRNRLHQAWFVIIGLAFVVSLSLITYANVRRGSSALLYQLAVIQQHAGAPQALAHINTAFYTPFRQQYQIDIPASDGTRMFDDNPLTITRLSDDTQQIAIDSAIGAIRYIVADHTVPALGVVSDLSSDDGTTLRGSITVTTPGITLTEAGILYGDVFYPLADLIATQPTQITSATTTIDFPCDIPRVTTQVISRYDAYESMFGPCGAVTTFPTTTAFLIGWSEPTIAFPTLTAVQPKTQQQLFVISLDVVAPQ